MVMTAWTQGNQGHQGKERRNREEEERGRPGPEGVHKGKRKETPQLVSFSFPIPLLLSFLSVIFPSPTPWVFEDVIT